MKSIILAALAALSTVTAADAAVITKGYKVTTSYANAPLTSVVSNFNLTFDPTLTGASRSIVIDNFSSTGGASFMNAGAAPSSFLITTAPPCPPVGFGFPCPAPTSFPIHTIQIFGGVNGSNTVPGTDDFDMTFTYDGSGNLYGNRTSYTTSGTALTYAGTFTSVESIAPIVADVAPDVVAAVPEPASWAMMIAGFGMVGGAMRRRKPVTTRLSRAA